jgi:hypothetical protein
MKELKEYNSLDEALEYFFSLLPELKPDRISAVSKYARVHDKDFKLQAIKQKGIAGPAWSFEITLS